MNMNHDTTEDINTRARALAQAAVEGLSVNPTGLIEYRSHGNLVIIGNQEAVEFAPRLHDKLKVQVILRDGYEEPGIAVIPAGGRPIRVTGYLGAFQITLGVPGKPNYQYLDADLVLDLSPDGIISTPIPPPGYLRSGLDENELCLAEGALLELVGTFEKPRFFEYNASICAHGRAGQTGCNRCVEACPTEAITSLAESIEVNPYLCQGGGICASVCPSGAIRYVYPEASDMLDRVRTLLRVYREQGGIEPIIAFVSEEGASSIGKLPPNVLLIVVEELPSIGMETWLSCLSYGARSVLLIKDEKTTDHVSDLLVEQIGITREILENLGFPANSIREIPASTPTVDSAAFMPEIIPATYAGLSEKRRVLFLAIDHLYGNALRKTPVFSLPAGAPFGTLHIDTGTCTLCMSCTSVCPVHAVMAGNELPRLVFNESNCIQCGICASACPEDAIQLETRLVADAELRQRDVILHEESPFYCVSCGKPFATNSIIKNVLARLEGHWMFQDENAKRRLMMCDDCRVVDIIQDEKAMEQGFVSRPRHQ